MSKILAGRNIDLKRGFAFTDNKAANETYMSITTEREALIKRLEELKGKACFYKENGRKGELNATLNLIAGCNNRLRTLKSKIEKHASLQDLMMDRFKQVVDPHDWAVIRELAKKDREEILNNISAW